jgi:hypothetical protein
MVNGLARIVGSLATSQTYFIVRVKERFIWSASQLLVFSRVFSAFPP